MNFSAIRSSFGILFLAPLLLTACGGGGGGGGSPTTYTIGGNISGLTGTVVLQNNGGNNLSRSADGGFTFSTALANGAAYNVTVLTQPAGQVCTVTNASGTVSGANITNVQVTCVPTYTIGGTISGHTDTVVLQNNGGDTLTVPAGVGSFVFDIALVNGAAYDVTVLIAPAGRICTVSNGSGAVPGANVINVGVSCTAPPTYTIGGMISGLAGTVVLQNNGNENLSRNVDGSFTFVTALASGAAYNVTVLTHPVGQTCTVSSGSGTVSATNITNVQVNCATNPVLTYTIGGTISGLTGTVVLRNNGGDNLTSSNGVFTFANPLASGAAYNVTMLAQPAGQTCTVTNGSGTVSGADVANVAVACVTNPKRWRTAALIETDDAGSALFPQIAFDATGNALAVWQHSDGTRDNITANRYPAAGPVWGTAAQIESDDAGNAIFPQIAFDATGNALAVWSQSDGARYNIWANRYTASTGLWGTAALIETDDVGSANSPQIAFDASGNAFIAVWHQSDGARNNIWANRYAAGAWVGAELIETDDLGEATFPQIAFDASGSALAVWQHSGGGCYNVMANRYTASVGWGTPAPIEIGNLGCAVFPQIAFDASGNALAVWQQSTPITGPIRYDIRASRYTGTWGTAVLIDTEDLGHALSPQIAVDAAGNALAVWHQSDGARTNIWANRYTASTGLWGTAALIETDNLGGAFFPQIAVDATTGNALAVWHQSDGARDNIWANRYISGVGWDMAAPIETDNLGNAGYPQIAIDANDNAFAVWHQSDGTRYNIWANRYE